MRSLGVEFVLQDQRDKRAALRQMLQQLQLQPSQSAFVGDDLVDLPAMSMAGLSIAVADAHRLVLEQAHWVTGMAGGRGAVREVCELLLDAHGLLEDSWRRHGAP